MITNIVGKPALASAHIELEGGESFLSTSGSLTSFGGGVEITASTGGGLMKSWFRSKLGQESLLMVRTSVPDDSKGWIEVAPRFQGDLRSEALQYGQELYVISGSAIGWSPSLSVNPAPGNIGTIALHEGAVVLKVAAKSQIPGTLLVSGFGLIEAISLAKDSSIVVDSGHLVLWSTSCRVSPGLAGGIITQKLTGEGIMARVTGPGTVWIQNRSESKHRSWLLQTENKKRGFFSAFTQTNS